MGINIQNAVKFNTKQINTYIIRNIISSSVESEQ